MEQTGGLLVSNGFLPVSPEYVGTIDGTTNEKLFLSLGIIIHVSNTELNYFTRKS